MSLEDILGAIESECVSSIGEIEAESDRRVAAVIAEARERGEAERSRLSSSRDESAAAASAQIVNRAKLVAERRIREAREALYLEARSRLMSRLETVRERPDYPEVFDRLLVEAREVLRDATLVRVDARDEGLAARFADGLVVEPSLESLGGVELSTRDGRRVRNTIESRVAKAEPAMRQLAIEEFPGLGVER